MCCDRCSKGFELCICNREGLSLYKTKFKDKNSFTCILSCCKSCSFCRRVAAKERHKSRSSKDNKICEKCFLCESLEYCKNVTNVPPVVPNLPVGARLHRFQEKWAALGISPKVLAVLREGYILPFRFRPSLTRKPTITSVYVNPHRNSYLLEALHQLLDKNAVELGQNPQSQHTQTLVALCRELGWLVNKEKSELEPTQVFNFVGYQFDLKNDRVRPTPERWQTLQTKIWDIMSSLVCPVRHLMSLIGLLTATEKQVHLGRLHMRPIQWHLKNNWRVPETLENMIPIPKSLHPHLRWWLEESNVITGQPLL